jgi:hypothetical protein
MNGGKHLGRHLFFLDNAATTEEKKKMMTVWTITKCVKIHMNHNTGAYPVTIHIMAALMLYVYHKKQTIIA